MQVPLYVTAALMMSLAAIALFALRRAGVKHAETEAPEVPEAL
jgi:DHA2 family multidrug resistance protein-like MFS transporter